MGSAYSNVVCILIPKVNELESLGLSGDMVGGAVSAFLPPAAPAAESLNLGGDFLAGTLTAIDPDFADVVLLLHMDGTNGATSFPDDSSVHNTVTPTNATVSTAHPMFGTGAAAFTGTGSNSHLRTPIGAAAPLDLSGEDYTVEFWLYQNALSGFTFNLCGSMASGQTEGFYVFCDPTGHLSATFRTVAGLVSVPSSPSPIPTNAWNAIAFERSGNTYTLYLNGVRTGVQIAATAGLDAQSGVFEIGSCFTSGTVGVNGQIDEFRITKGVARYSGASYTPTGPFPNG